MSLQLRMVQLICCLCCTFNLARGKLDIILKQGESEDECNLLLLGMDSDFVASTHNNNPAVGKMTLGGALTLVEFEQSLLRQKSGCVIGVAPVSQVGGEHNIQNYALLLQ